VRAPSRIASRLDVGARQIIADADAVDFKRDVASEHRDGLGGLFGRA
jgi:hypothetical protein